MKNFFSLYLNEKERIESTAKTSKGASSIVSCFESFFNEEFTTLNDCIHAVARANALRISRGETAIF